MDVEKYGIGAKFAIQSLISANVNMTATEAYEFLNTVNPDARSSCWCDCKMLRGGGTA